MVSSSLNELIGKRPYRRYLRPASESCPREMDQMTDVHILTIEPAKRCISETGGCWQTCKSGGEPPDRFGESGGGKGPFIQEQAGGSIAVKLR